jgi:hypothetical protein
MSQFPPQQGSFSPSQAPYSGPPKSSNTGKVILIVVAVVGGLCLLCCGVVGFVIYRTTQQVGSMIATSFAQFGDDLKLRIEDSPILTAEVGQVQTVTFSMGVTGKYKTPDVGNVLGFEVVGTKGKCDVLAKAITTEGDGAIEYEWARLHKANGEVVDIPLAERVVSDGATDEEFEAEPAKEMSDQAESGSAEPGDTPRE